MITQIGFIAGEILTLLARSEDPVYVEDIKCGIDAPDQIVLMSLGWLIRESYVYAIPHAADIEIKQIGNNTNEGLQERALDISAVTV